MGENLKKSRRNWRQLSGHRNCDECGEGGFSRYGSFKPSILILCQPCWKWIYVEDRGKAPQPTLFDKQ